MKDGGPAFPEVWYDLQPDTGKQVVREQYSGMTLRDYIATQSLPVFLREFWGEEGGMKQAAIGSYQMADVMLEARKGVQE